MINKQKNLKSTNKREVKTDTDQVIKKRENKNKTNKKKDRNPIQTYE
jgi:hypothetical protein